MFASTLLQAIHPLRAGILFPESYLESRPFRIWLTFVAINTLIYLGLTLIKLMPRPKPQFLRAEREGVNGKPKRRFF